MLKTVVITIIICLTFHTEYVDVYQYSDTKTVELLKRQVPAETKPTDDNIKINNDNNEQKNNVGQNVDGQQKNVGEKIEGSDKHIQIDKEIEKNITSVGMNNNVNQTESYLVKNNTIIGHGKIEHNGAIYRSFYVFFGLSIIVLIYISFRTFKMRPGAPAPATVRKYGIIGRRSDMEMQPLPLNEEDDDDTLFDAGRQHQQHS